MTRGPSIDEMSIPGRPADTLLIAYHAIDGEVYVALCLLDVENESWLLHLTDEQGVRDIIASLEGHLEGWNESR